MRFGLTIYEIGDVNLDGLINVNDVTAIQRHFAELELFSDDQLALADTNGDEVIDISDATHLKMYLAEYDVELGGADAICFTAGVLENTPRARLSVMQKLDCLGVIPDIEANNVPSQFQKVSANDSKIDCFIVPTDEELMIAEDTYELVLQGL